MYLSHSIHNILGGRLIGVMRNWIYTKKVDAPIADRRQSANHQAISDQFSGDVDEKTIVCNHHHHVDCQKRVGTAGFASRSVEKYR